MSKTKEPTDFDRYARQVQVPGFGSEGQERLKTASVLIVGAGGLGTPLAQYLVGAGVGRVGIAEFDRVDISNLHRQILYTTDDVGKSKLAVACERLKKVNPAVEVVPIHEVFSRENARRLVEGYSCVADGSDRFEVRYAVNEACVAESIPLVSASVLGWEGQLSCYVHPEGPCYACLFPESPPVENLPNCDSGGAMGPVVGTLACLQATEVLKVLLGRPSLVGTLLSVDGATAEFTRLKFSKNPQCGVCSGGSQNPTIDDLEVSIQGFQTVLIEREEVLVIQLGQVDPDPFAPYNGRTRAEFVSLDTDEQVLDLLKKQTRTVPIFVVCEAGSRSLKLALRLSDLGIRAKSVAGGFRALRALGPN